MIKLHKGVVIFTDGASRGNPGNGGWAFGLIDTNSEHVHEAAGFAPKTTNNNMELTAVVKALEFAVKSKISNVEIFTDSAYVAQGMTMWIFGWVKNGWKTKTGDPISNVTEWKKCFTLMQQVKCSVLRISGHSGVAMNERVDVLATESADTKKNFKKSYTFNAYVKIVGEFLDVPTNIRPAKPSSSGKEKKAAYSYVSEVNGIIMTHKTWDETKARVHGKAAKYKKAFSVAEEAAIKKEFEE